MNTCGDCIHAKICKEVYGGWFSDNHIACNGFRAEQRWIPVTERLPKMCADVLVYYASGEINIGFRTPSLGFMYEVIYGEATHWMPLPSPPKEDE